MSDHQREWEQPQDRPEPDANRPPAAGMGAEAGTGWVVTDPATGWSMGSTAHAEHGPVESRTGEYRTPELPAAGYGPAGYGPPGYGPPGYGPPGYGPRGYGAAGYGPPGYGAPGYGTPGYGTASYGTAESRPDGPGGGFGPPPAAPVGAVAPPLVAPPRGRSVPSLGVLALMVVAAVGGGIAGASLYANTADRGSPAANGGPPRVVDAPQLDYASVAGIASEVRPSVVSIRVGEFGGSGVVMSEDGYILTNAHVVAPSPDGQVSVRFSDGETSQATVVGADGRSDIAVIHVEDGADLTPARLGDSDDVLVGDAVLAIGSPLGYEGSVTQGIVSALDRTLRPEEPGAPTLSGLLQTDAAINRGNSGGALVNLAGEVVGINTAIAVQDPEGGFLGLGFAVPSNRAADVAQQLIAGEEISHAFLGVHVGPAEGGGAVIGDVSPGSPAEQAGLQNGDVVVRIGDRQIADDSDLVSAVHSAEAGQPIEVEYLRDGSTRTTTVTLAEAPD